MLQDSREKMDQFHKKIHQQIQNLFNIEDISGIELFFSLNRAAQLSEMLDSIRFDGQDLSAPRWRLMLHLFMAEQMGKPASLTPTELSRFQQVSKNTISALLRGLEEQGFISRESDPKDLRIFRIHLTESGRELILKTAPGRIRSLNQMLSSLPREDIEQLTSLLKKLRHSLEDQFCQIQKDQTN